MPRRGLPKSISTAMRVPSACTYGKQILPAKLREPGKCCRTPQRHGSTGDLGARIGELARRSPTTGRAWYGICWRNCGTLRDVMLRPLTLTTVRSFQNVER